MRHLRIALPLVLFLMAFNAIAQTTGGLTGQATDSSGAALPGVTVEARSPALQGVRTDITDALGNFRFLLLPPGSYEVRFLLEGFGTESRRDVKVGLGRDATVDAVMKPAAVSETMTVTGEALSPS